MKVQAVAAVPAAARLRAVAEPGPGADLFAAAREAVAVDVGIETRVLVTAGPSGVVHDRAVVSGVDGAADLEVPVDGELMAAVSGRTGFSRGRTDRLGGDLAELVRWCAELAPQIPLLPLEVPEHAGTGTLEAVAAGLRAAADVTGRAVAVVAAGDLAVSGEGAGDGHPPGSAAARFDEQAVTALRRGDPAALAALGPQEARSVGAKGWAPLLIVSLLARMAGLSPGTPLYQCHRGCGRVVIAP